MASLPNGTAVTYAIDISPATTGTVFGGQTDGSQSESCDSIETSDKDTDSKTYIPGKHEPGTVTFDMTYAPADTALVEALADMRTPASTVVSRFEGGSGVQEAPAHVTNVSINSPDNGRATASVEFKLEGPWVTYAV